MPVEVTAALRREAEASLSDWGIFLPEASWVLLDKYVRDVLEYNRKVNITAAKDAAALLRRHVLDGFAPVRELKRLLKETPAPRLLDVGAGAGFTGFAVKLAWPEAEVSLMESSYRKFCFLNLAGARLGLKGLRILNERAGPSTEGGYDAVLARAVAPMPQALALALPLAHPGGYAAVYQSKRPEASAAGLACDFQYRLPGEDASRWLAFFRRKD